MTKRNGRSDSDGPGADGGGSSQQEELADTIESAHDLPGFYPIVLIAKSGTGFRKRLESELGRLQKDAPYKIRRRRSARGNYKAYRVEIHVSNGQMALARKAALSQLPGVILVL